MGNFSLAFSEKRKIRITRWVFPKTKCKILPWNLLYPYLLKKLHFMKWCGFFQRQWAKLKDDNLFGLLYFFFLIGWNTQLEWVAISFSRGTSQPRDWTWVFCLPGRSLTIWATREAPSKSLGITKEPRKEVRKVDPREVNSRKLRLLK